MTLRSLATAVFLAWLLPMGTAIASDVAGAAAGAVKAAMTPGDWFALIGAAVIPLAVQAMHAPLFKSWLSTVPRKYRIGVPIAISAICAVLGASFNVIGWEEAVKVGIELATGSVFLAELVLGSVMKIRNGESHAPGTTPPVSG